MTRIFTRFIIFIFTSFLFAISAQAADKYTLDPSHSAVTFHISHFGFSNPSGKWYVTGNLLLDEKKPQDSKVDVTIQVADMVTGNSELDKHLKSDNFFDVKKYPTATFVSDKINITGKKTAKVHGILTVHGVSKPVTLDVTLNKSGVNPIHEKQTVGFTASTKLKRSDFNMNTLLPGLGDEVKINIEAEATKTS